jgi:uncharacterized protein (TIGR02246 family)
MRLPTKYRHPAFLPLLLAFIAIAAHAAPASNPAADSAAIRSVLDQQVAAWNRGDIATFMQGYNNSPATTFVGKTVQHGYANILARYQTSFAGIEKMGQLAFSDLEITPITAEVAAVTGRFHLTRNAAGGGDAAGVFSLVLQKTPAGWKIVLDHTCS